MCPSQRALTEDIKREIIDELQLGHRAGIGYGSESQESPFRRVAEQTYESVKDSVKEEVLAEVRAQQAEKIARERGLGGTLSEQRIRQLVDERYRAIDNLKADIKKELQALQEIEARRAKNPHIRQVAIALAEEAHRQGISSEQLVRNLDQDIGKSSGMMGRVSQAVNTGQRKGFLCGAGTMLLLYLLMPSLRSRMHSVAVRSMEEGMAMVDRAKSFVSNRQQQGSPDNFQQPSPDGGQPHPEGEQPPMGDNIQ